MVGKTQVAIAGDDFLINGQPTYREREWQGHRIEGLLFNSRMVNATFDDLNPDTRDRWAYPDTGVWDPERNTDEFIAMLPEYRRHGVLAVTLNLQGGAPGRYVTSQPWINSAFTAYGELRPTYLGRLGRALEALDEQGMVAIVGYFYFTQDRRLLHEDDIRRGAVNATRWLLDSGHTNVIVEVANECNVPKYEHAILKPPRVHELIAQVRDFTKDGRRLPVGASFTSQMVPTDHVLEVSDLALIHGNGAREPALLADYIARVRAARAYRPMPVVVNEDNHFAFDQPENNLIVATARHVSWGYYDNGPGEIGARWRRSGCSPAGRRRNDCPR
jgi:hypothetical protein